MAGGDRLGVARDSEESRQLREREREQKLRMRGVRSRGDARVILENGLRKNFP